MSDLKVGYIAIASALAPKAIASIFNKRGTLSGLVGSDSPKLMQLGLSMNDALTIASIDIKKAQEEYDRLKALGGELITLESPEYPELLREIATPPPLLYALGNLDCLSKLCIAIVGARMTSKAGERIATKIATGLAVAGATVVSGFAYGIDISAHLATIKASGSAVAVLGSGLANIYPAKHRKYVADTCKDGCILSELPLDADPHPFHFPKRNRIISGLSRGVLVVEASERSGSLVTAKLAVEQNRDVFAVPTFPLSLNNATNQLIKMGAKLTENALDILNEYGHLIDISAKPTEETDNYDNSPTGRICKVLAIEPLTIDELVDKVNIGYSELAALLMEMELAGKINRESDGKYINA